MALKVRVMDNDPLASTTFVDFMRLRLDDATLRLTLNEKGQYFTVTSRTK